MAPVDRREHQKLVAMRDRLANNVARELTKHFDRIGHPCHAGMLAEYMRFVAYKAAQQERRFWRRRGTK